MENRRIMSNINRILNQEITDAVGEFVCRRHGIPNQKFSGAKKMNIDIKKVNIDAEKVDIEKLFRPKVAGYVTKLRDELKDASYFGRSDIVRILNIKPTRASAIIKQLFDYGIIISVEGHGKGKYRFKKNI